MIKFFGKNQLASYKVLLEMVDDGGGVVTIDEWRNEMRAHGVARNRFYESWKAMVKNGVIAVDGDLRVVVLKRSDDGAMQVKGRTRERNKPKGRSGIHPYGDDWFVAGEMDGWILYSRSEMKSGWLNLKLVAKERMKHKANYSLAWNGERFAEASDFFILKGYHMDLFNWVKGKL